MAKIHTIDGVQYREVARDAKVGDFLLFEEAPYSFLTSGKVYKVTGIDSYGDPEIIDDEGDKILIEEEYVVLEPITSADIIVHDGVQYRKVDRPVREGDFILALVDEDDLVKGKAYKVSCVCGDSNIDVIDDADDAHYLLKEEYVVLEPVETATPSLSTLESELAAMKAKVAEMEAQLAAVKQAEAEAQRLKVGDYVKIGRVKPGVFTEGEYGKITGDDQDAVPYRVESLDGKKAAWFRGTTLTRATDEEVAEAKRKLALENVKVGDFVKVMRYRSGHPVGTIGKVVKVFTGEHRSPDAKYNNVRVEANGWTYFEADVEPVGAEELVEIKEAERKKAEEAKWHAIGREVGEFREGDVVKTLQEVGGHPVGTVGVIARLHSDNSHVIEANGKCHYHTALELIAPVESVVNLRAGDAA